MSDLNNDISDLQRAAGQGNVLSQIALGRHYLDGDGVSTDQHLATEWFRKAAASGNSEAEVRLGVCYEEGYGLPKDSIKAVELYQKAAVNGNSWAALRLGRCYYYGTGVEKDSSKAVEFFQRASPEESIGETWLGVCYEEAYGLPKDSIKAVELYQKAAVRGSSWAAIRLGRCYYYGIGVEKDSSKAVEFFQQASPDESVAETWLGVCYEEGYGLPKDLSKAVELYRNAAARGSSWATLRLGRCYYYGTGVEKDSSQAVEFFQQASPDNSEAEAWLGFCYEEGHGLPKDLSKAVKLYRNAAVSGSSWAAFKLGRCYYYGIGVEKDSSKAVEFFQQASPDESDAEAWLGFCYEKGEGLPKDLNKSIEFYEKAAVRDSLWAALKLGRCYEYGIGLPANFTKAAALYRQAAKQEVVAKIALHQLISGKLVETDHQYNPAKIYREIEVADLTASDCWQIASAADLNNDYAIALKYYERCLSAKDFNSMLGSERADIKRTVYFRSHESTTDYFNVLASCAHLHTLSDHTIRLFIPTGLNGYSSLEVQTLIDCVHKWMSVLTRPLKVVLVTAQRHANLSFVPVKQEMFDGTASARTCYLSGYSGQLLEKKRRCLVQLPKRNISSEDDLTNAICLYMHEIGHALGLHIHSIFADDIMSTWSYHLVTPSARDVSAINNLYKHGAETNILAILENEASANNPYALGRLGAYYMANRNYKQAIDLLSRASDFGEARAQVQLGSYHFKRGNYKKAAALFEQAVEQGLPEAHQFLGICYLGGRGVKSDPKTAVEMLQVAAENGLTLSQNSLGFLSTFGNATIPKDYEKAARLYRNARASGSRIAIFLLFLNSVVKLAHGLLRNKKRMMPEPKQLQ